MRALTLQSWALLKEFGYDLVEPLAAAGSKMYRYACVCVCVCERIVCAPLSHSLYQSIMLQYLYVHTHIHSYMRSVTPAEARKAGKHIKNSKYLRVEKNADRILVVHEALTALLEM
jgi:hypothetical protein